VLNIDNNCILKFIVKWLHCIGKEPGYLSQYSVFTTYWTTGGSRFDPRQRGKDFSSSLFVQTGSGAHPASCLMGSGGPFPGGKARPGRNADLSPPSNAEVENE
jgi:hypothetical protein